MERVASDVQDLKEALNERPRVKDVTALLNTKADVEVSMSHST